MTDPAPAGRLLPPGPEAAAAARVAAAVRRVSGSREEMTVELVKLLRTEITTLPQDDDMLETMKASVDESVATGLHVLEHGIDPRSLGAPQAATHYARRLAQRGVPVSALLRAYRLGSSAFIETMLAELAGQPGADAAAEASAANMVMLRTTTAYVDAVSEALVEAYEQEQEAWSRQHSMARSARIKALLDGGDLDVDATEIALGYRLRQNHLAALLWFDERDGVDLLALDRVAGAAAAVHGGGYLLVPTDEASASLWLSVPDELEDLGPLIAALAEGHRPAPRVALGRPAFGAAGFRATHRQASQARAVAVVAGRDAAQVTTHADVGAIGLLCLDLTATRAWIADTLGALATDDENAERLRETVRVFLNLGSSYTAAAEKLCMHKNSVQYRVQKAEALRGQPFRADRADVELALRACRVLGSAALPGAT